MSQDFSRWVIEVCPPKVVSATNEVPPWTAEAQTVLEEAVMEPGSERTAPRPSARDGYVRLPGELSGDTPPVLPPRPSLWRTSGAFPTL